ncbi:hypothetical protein LCGC14_2541970 [marine sediment metagenome]|uniref:Uncharacterized protein n=1 Tax=marine sediment metagenome TaxID=412755 RepID=A0A0F9AQX1_9ZZZZ
MRWLTKYLWGLVYFFQSEPEEKIDKVKKYYRIMGWKYNDTMKGKKIIS